MPREIASVGVASWTGRPHHSTSPAVRRMTPVRSLIRVDLPAPFSPTIAWISPDRNVTSAGFSASTRPYFFWSPRNSRMGAPRGTLSGSAILASSSCRWLSSSKLLIACSRLMARMPPRPDPGGVVRMVRRRRSIDLRIEQRVDLRVRHVFLRHQVRTGIDERFDLLAFRDGQRRLDAVISHAIGILHHEAGQHAFLQEADRLVVAV